MCGGEDEALWEKIYDDAPDGNELAIDNGLPGRDSNVPSAFLCCWM
jgi:hypothetical protein